MKQIIRALVILLSDGSNKDLDYTKVLGAVAFAVFMGLSIHSFGYKNAPWDPMNWAIAVGTLLAATGATSKIKDFTTQTKTPP